VTGPTRMGLQRCELRPPSASVLEWLAQEADARVAPLQQLAAHASLALQHGFQVRPGLLGEVIRLGV
jgi:hypothetical protein